MSTEKKQRDIDILISKIMRFGVMTSAVITGIGLFLFLVTGESGYSGEEFPHTIDEIALGLVACKPYAIILLGILCLIFTPIMRVASSIFIFWKEKDFIYVGITSLVLTILIVSMLLGKVG